MGFSVSVELQNPDTAYSGLRISLSHNEHQIESASLILTDLEGKSLLDTKLANDHPHSAFGSYVGLDRELLINAKSTLKIQLKSEDWDSRIFLIDIDRFITTPDGKRWTDAHDRNRSMMLGFLKEHIPAAHANISSRLMSVTLKNSSPEYYQLIDEWDHTVQIGRALKRSSPEYFAWWCAKKQSEAIARQAPTASNTSQKREELTKSVSEQLTAFVEWAKDAEPETRSIAEQLLENQAAAVKERVNALISAGELDNTFNTYSW